MQKAGIITNSSQKIKKIKEEWAFLAHSQKNTKGFNLYFIV